jgi:hypothetical protein
MLVSNLQQFLLLLLPPLRAAGISAGADKSVTSNLEAMSGALAPFKDLSIEQLSDLLKVAHEYRQSGQLPDWILGKKPAAPRAKTSTPKPPKPPKMTPDEALAKLLNLRSESPHLEPDRISQEVETLKALTVPQLKALQKEFLGASSGKTKDEQIAAIASEVFSYRESRRRSMGILNG